MRCKVNMTKISGIREKKPSIAEPIECRSDKRGPIPNSKIDAFQAIAPAKKVETSGTNGL